MTVDLAILNYRGRHHLEHLLPTALAEASSASHSCRVVVVDNRSGDGEEAWVREHFPDVVFWEAPQNDFLFSYNEFASESAADVIVLLNNDLKLKPGFVDPLVRHFRNDEVFSVGATSRDWEDREFTCGPSRLTRAHGSYLWAYEWSNQKLQHTLFTSGGFMAVSRMKFLELGGFDRMYRPAYCEDLDLCFRAWRRGWRCIFEPSSVALHRDKGSWSTAGKSRLNQMLLRNSLLFQWSSLPMHQMRWQRRLFTSRVAVGTLAQGDIGWARTFWNTLQFWKTHKSGRPLSPATPEELCAIEQRMEARVQVP